MSEKKKGLSGVLSDIANFAEKIGNTVAPIVAAIQPHTTIAVQPMKPPVTPPPSTVSSPPPNPTPAEAAARKGAFGWKLAVGAAGFLLLFVVFAAGLFKRR